MKSFEYGSQRLNARADCPNELDTTFIQEDGFKRNLMRLRWEWRWASHWARKAEAGHGGRLTAALNQFVEHLRHAPYAWGHLLAYAVGLLIVLTTILTLV